jgi:hypothetical protein
MGDNIALTPGSGVTALADERTVGGVTGLVQRVAPHGTPNLTVGQVEVTNSSTAICAVDATRQTITIVNRQLVSVYIDDTTATTSAFRLDPGDSVTLATGAVINGITSAAYTAVGDAKVHYVATHD